MLLYGDSVDDKLSKIKSLQHNTHHHTLGKSHTYSSKMSFKLKC